MCGSDGMMCDVGVMCGCDGVMCGCGGGMFLVCVGVSACIDLLLLQVKQVSSRQDYPDELKWVKFSSIAWTHDNRGFFYQVCLHIEGGGAGLEGGGGVCVEGAGLEGRVGVCRGRVGVYRGRVWKEGLVCVEGGLGRKGWCV